MGFYCYLRENPTSEYSCTFRNHVLLILQLLTCVWNVYIENHDIYMLFSIYFEKIFTEIVPETKHYGKNDNVILLGNELIIPPLFWLVLAFSVVCHVYYSTSGNSMHSTRSTQFRTLPAEYVSQRLWKQHYL
ncbi:hypothetical protein T12_7913 [Trichinella patagoniensis]|uniref:Uncharacterized protein n=1 Tax=Trichinella patagoniensis TaxID=990121 RepID=A0A0V0ZDQ8_9BILA|nr:hypothetical protein T12_7913 [Trichinella patagoniensis]